MVLSFQSEPPALPYLWKKQNETVIGDNAGDTLGWAVALSADASTLVVGAPGVYQDDEIRGYVKVYYRDDVMKLGWTIHGVAVGDLFGYSIDIAADGKFLAIGSPGDRKKNDRPGYVRVYHRESIDDLGSSWKRLGQDITGEVIGDEFGRFVSLSDDGKTLAVAAERNDGFGQEGRVQIYQFEGDSTSWKQLGQDIVGEELSLSGDGKTVAIGAPWNSEHGKHSGCVKVYRIDIEKLRWEQQGQTIYGEATYDLIGWFVDISAGGTILAVGSAGYQAYDRPGYVRVYHLEIGDDLGFMWKKLGQDITGGTIGDEYGFSGYLSNDGNSVAVGAYHDGKGHVGVYRIDNSSLTWTQQGEAIRDDAAYSRETSLSLSEDGKTVVIGSFGNDDNGTDSGQVRIFTKE